jgi:hypothetical protein
MMNLIKTMEETLERKNSNETKIREFRATPWTVYTIDCFKSVQNYFRLLEGKSVYSEIVIGSRNSNNRIKHENPWSI